MNYKKFSMVFRVFTIINLLLRGMGWRRNVHFFLNARLNINMAFFTLWDVQEFKRPFLSYSSGCFRSMIHWAANREMRQWNSLGHVPTPHAGGRKLMWTRGEQVITLDRGKANLRYGSHFKPERVTFGRYYPPENSFCRVRRSRFRHYYSEMDLSENITWGDHVYN